VRTGKHIIHFLFQFSFALWCEKEEEYRDPATKDYDASLVSRVGGREGERTRHFIEQWLGYHKPKQFCLETYFEIIETLKRIPATCSGNPFIENVEIVHLLTMGLRNSASVEKLHTAFSAIPSNFPKMGQFGCNKPPV